MSPFEIVQACTNCKKPRVEVTIDQVSAKHRPGVEKMCVQLKAAGMAVRQIVYCKNCDEYSSFSDWAAF
jgi:hypothetical protein